MPSLNEIPLKLRNPINSKTLTITNPKITSSPKRNSASIRVQNQGMTERSKKKSTKILALFYGLLSGFFFSACAANVKYLEDLDPGQVAFYQNIAITLFSLPMVIKHGESLLGPNKTTKYWILLCGTFDAVTDYCSFISFRYLPLSDATVLTSSVPVFVTISARIFLKEKCGTFQILAVIISILGVVLVSKVPLLMMNRTDVYTRESIIGLTASFASIATESGVYIILRKIHDTDAFLITFHFGVVATVVNAILTFAFGRFTMTFCGIQQYLVIAVGAFSFLCQLTLNKALELEEAGPVSVLMAAGDIILAFVLDITLFKDTPDVYTIAGTILVVSSVMLIGFKKWFEDNEKSKSLKIKLCHENRLLNVFSERFSIKRSAKKSINMTLLEHSC